MSHPFARRSLANRPLRRRKSTQARAMRLRRQLRFERLEDRRLLALITVDTLLDENDGVAVGSISLRDALADADPNDVIEFDVEGTISLIHGELHVDRTLSVAGPGADLLTVDARGTSRVFNVDDGSGGAPISVSLSGLTITGGNTGADGGGILNRETLTVAACHITGNEADDGGGIGNFSGTFSIFDSTISDNTAANWGGGVFNFSASKLQTSTISNSTVSQNKSLTRGGGINNFLGTLFIDYSTITKNEAPAGEGSGVHSWTDTNTTSTQVRASIIAGNLNSDVDLFPGAFPPTVQSLSYNLIGTGNGAQFFTAAGDQRNVANPQLGPLADNGGPTPTHMPLVGSPAIDSGDPTFFPPAGIFDQRGLPHPRVFDGNGDSVNRVDKGAVERDVLYFQVDTPADENDGNFLAGDFSLREAIGQASQLVAGTPTIVFAPSLTAGGPATILLALGDLDIADRVTIEGPGANLLTIHAQQNSRIFNIDDELAGQVDVRISGLTLTGGRDNNAGGAIFSQEKLTVRESVISGNTAQWGGGIYNAEFGTLTLERSRVTGNHAIEPAPMAIGSGGGLYNWGGRINILDSTISGNDSVSAGGGILNANNGAVKITRSTIGNNTAATTGGGIHNGDGNITIDSSTISGNHAQQGGGLLIVTPNTRITSISNSTISGNIAPLGGGGTNNQSGQVFFEFCTITANIANDFAGSGVLSAPSPTDSPTSFYSCIIAANLAPDEQPGPGKLDIAVSGGTNSFISRGYNIVGIGGFVEDTFDEMGDQIIGEVDPLLGPLADSGGPTQTHALLFGSPALDQGDPSPVSESAGVPKYDQRGKPFARIRDGDIPASIVMDVGAFEAQSIPPALPGDYNLNGTVDTVDYAVWRKTLNGSVLAYTGADGNGDGTVNQADYTVWRSQYGKSLPPGTAAVSSVANVTAGVAAPAGRPPALPGVSRALSPKIVAISTSRPKTSARPFNEFSPVTIAQNDAALRAWLMSRTIAERADYEPAIGNRIHRNESLNNIALNDAAFDAAFTAIGADFGNGS